MRQFVSNAQDSETSSHYADMPRTELARQHDGRSGEIGNQINREVGDMSDKRFLQVQGAQHKGGPGEKSRDKSAALAEVRDGFDSSRKTPEGTTQSRRDDSDRQAIERGEDEGMMVPME